ncbi:MAG: hypothetical protein WCY19_07505 [Candidatus Gastranaerophilaceae bacterium]
MKKISTDFKYLILLGIILVLAIIPTYAHHGHLLVDCGREAYYPTQILLGKVLYKDILNIYGPFSYMFNAFLFKIFGINLNVLYLAGCVCSFLIAALIYLISRRFLPDFLSFSIAVFTILVGVSSHYLSNFIFPYSYAMLYGLVGFLLSMLFLLKYASELKISNLYLSCFFAGLCVTGKYEFLPFLIVIFYAMIKVRPLKIKEYYYTIFSLLFMPVFCFGILFLQGLNMQDLIMTGSIIKKMAHTRTLKYFYRSQGVYFSTKFMQIQIVSFLKTIFPLTCFLYGFKSRNKILSILLILLSSFLITQWTTPISFSLIPLLIVVLAIFNFKNLKNNFALQLLVLSAVLFSTKVFWGLITANYGAFFIGFLLITFIAIISDIFKDKNINYKAIGIYILLAAGVLSYINFSSRGKYYPLETARGNFYTQEYLYQAGQDLIDYINKNTKKTDKIVIYPEGAMINFMTDRPSDNFYTSLIPLYVETFGEDKLIENLKKTKPEYVIFNDWNTQEYSFKYICKDYAVSFCNFVATNYTQEKVIGKKFRYLIFKRR